MGVTLLRFQVQKGRQRKHFEGELSLERLGLSDLFPLLILLAHNFIERHKRELDRIEAAFSKLSLMLEF